RLDACPQVLLRAACHCPIHAGQWLPWGDRALTPGNRVSATTYDHLVAHELTIDEVRHVAKLARISLTDAEAERFRGELAAVLAHGRCLEGLDLAGVEPMAHPGEGVNVLRADEAGEPLPVDAVMGMAPEGGDGYIRVPRVLGE